MLVDISEVANWRAMPLTMPDGKRADVTAFEYEGKTYVKRSDVACLAGFVRRTSHFTGVTEPDWLDVKLGQRHMPHKFWGENTVREFRAVPFGAKNAVRRRQAGDLVLQQVFGIDTNATVQATLPSFDTYNTVNTPELEEKIIQRALEKINTSAMEKEVLTNVTAEFDWSALEEKIIQRAFESFDANALEDKIYLRVLNKLKAGFFGGSV